MGSYKTSLKQTKYESNEIRAVFVITAKIYVLFSSSSNYTASKLL